MKAGKGGIGAIPMTWRWLSACGYRSTTIVGLALLLSACAGAPPVPYSVPPALGESSDLHLKEPAPSEVIVIVNDNNNQVHAGLFVGNEVVDPAGSYKRVRGFERDWSNATLKDYIRFQLEDGPEVRLYRFHLSSEAFARLKLRVEEDGFTPPLFCATKVQNLISGIPPFQSVPDTWLVSPATVGYHLDRILHDHHAAGACNWPDGSSCYASSRQ